MGKRRYPLLLSLAFLSGVCGLAYEVLYARLLTTYLGDMVQVSAAILASFLMGLGIGSLVAHRWYRWLWLIEALIGVYGLAIALAFTALSPISLGALLPHTATNVVPLVVCVAALVAVPSVLIGCSVPLFAAYLTEAQAEDSGANSFARVYTLYNLGAGLCVLALEFWLLRAFGLRSSVIGIALVNFVTAGALKRAVPVSSAPAVAPPKPARFVLSNAFIALFVVSALSASYQLLMLRFVGTVFGPFHENFALLLWLVMTGLALGSTLVRRFHIRLAPLLLVGGLVLLSGAALLGDEARLWAYLSGTFVDSTTARSALKAVVLLLMALPAFTIFGATVPALLRSRPVGRAEPGRALAISSFGNCLGFLLSVFVLLERLSYLALVLTIAVGTLGCGVALSSRRLRRVAAATVGAIALVAVLSARWPERQFSLGHLNFLSSEKLAKAEQDFVRAESIKSLDGDVTIVTTRSGAEYVTINGYSSFAVAQEGTTNQREVIVGIAPALYPKQRGKALVLGTGTGITAGAAASVFDHTTVVEINPAVYDALPRFSAHNFGLSERPNVALLLDDGLSVLARRAETYDVVISTVTSPLHFSSSKLYTVDFFDLVKARLAPGGVFAFGFDARLSEEGTAVILETMAQSFADCHFVFLHSSYYEAICGVETLHPRPLESWPEEVRRAMTGGTGDLSLNAFLDTIVLKPTRLTEHRWARTANTFDLPVLEHLMAREALAADPPWDLDGWVQFALADSAVLRQPFTGRRLAERCHLFARIGVRFPLPQCTARVAEAERSKWDRHYVNLACDQRVQTK
ncbi:MAG: hypothetical protein JRI68_31385 [Deltaproteobacteria bacterium]|nr:hypothetical protein [Deltaproteobacteria bacterium]